MSVKTIYHAPSLGTTSFIILTMRFFLLSIPFIVSLLPVALSNPVHSLIGRPRRSNSPRAAQTALPTASPTASPSPSPSYGIVLEGEFIKLDSRVPISSCPQVTIEYLQVLQTSNNNLRVPHSRIVTNGQPCGPLPENATREQLLADSYMELIPIDHLLTIELAEEHGVLGAYKKLNSKRPYTFRFYRYVVEEREMRTTGPMSYVGYERYSTRKCGDVELSIQSLVFFGTVLEVPVNLTGLIPRLQQGAIRHDVRLQVGREFHVTFSLNGTNAEHVCPSVLRRRLLPPIPEVRECFPRGMKVSSGRGVIDVADVEVGDELFDGNDYSDVVMLTHHDDNTVRNFVEIILDNGLVVQASRGHYLESAKGLIKAGDVTADTWLMTVQGMRIVSYVQSVQGRGLYNMQTASGRVVVGGVIASCYTEAVAPFVGHALLAPVRFVYTVGKRALSLYQAARVILFGAVHGDFGVRMLELLIILMVRIVS